MIQIICNNNTHINTVQKNNRTQHIHFLDFSSRFLDATQSVYNFTQYKIPKYKSSYILLRYCIPIFFHSLLFHILLLFLIPQFLPIFQPWVFEINSFLLHFLSQFLYFVFSSTFPCMLPRACEATAKRACFKHSPHYVWFS